MTGCRPRRPARGVTLVELMVAMGLSLLLSTLMLAAVRGQLMAFEMSDQVTQAQQSARAGLDYLESLGRRACGGAPLGAVGINLPGVAQRVVSCLRVIDGAQLSGGGFVAGSAATLPDALELILATSPLTVSTGALLTTTQPQVDVADRSGFSVGGLVLVGDGQQADLFQISALVPAAAGTGGTLRLGTLSAAVVSPQTPALVLPAGSLVTGAQAVSVYVTATPPVLMLDPDGPVGADHADAQPLVEGVEDLQLAVGVDTAGDGVVAEDPSAAGADEWIGNVAGEVLPGPPWNRAGTGDPQPRLLRITLVCRTANTYAGVVPPPGPYEDRVTYSVTATTSPPVPRFRPLRVSVAPRAFNLNQ